ncbi:MAG TPA: choice-of-anchor tandem repeat GloVer-containing protein, partial [Candidatus Binatia bacterium]|nr:choice-of-anchor tandem repeat GloVer-containing protein [Candidatus Binatia bacterium]
NLYGTLLEDGPNGNGGVFQFDPSTGQLNVLFSGTGVRGNEDGPAGGVVLDQSGNVYAADPYRGANNFGFVLELTPSNGTWIFTGLHEFIDGTDGGYPYGPLVIDANGSIYGANQSNVIFQITP